MYTNHRLKQKIKLKVQTTITYIEYEDGTKCIKNMDKLPESATKWIVKDYLDNILRLHE